MESPSEEVHGRYHKLANTRAPLPASWSVEELDSCFVVKDASGQALAYMYFEKELFADFGVASC